MLINTEVFGEIQIDKDKIIKFKEGLLGFEEEKEFAIINMEEVDSPFQWLQSVNTPELTFIITNPFYAFPDYEFTISKKVQEKLEIEDENDIAIYSIVVIPKDMEKMTANLLGPIIINIDKKLGKQVILDDNRYSTKHFIFQQKVGSGGN